MARPKVVVVSPLSLLPSSVLSTIVRTHPHPKSGVLEPLLVVIVAEFLSLLYFFAAAVSHIPRHLRPPSFSSPNLPRPPGLCSELDLIVASDSFVFLWQTRKRVRRLGENTPSGEVGRRSWNETLDILLCIMSFSLTYQRGHLRPSISPFYGCRIAQYGISSPLRLVSFFVVLILSYEIFISPPTPQPPPICQT